MGLRAAGPRPSATGRLAALRERDPRCSAPGSAQPLPSAVGDEGTCGPLATAALYACVTKGQSWDVESRISLVVSMLPSNLEEERKTPEGTVRATWAGGCAGLRGDCPESGHRDFHTPALMARAGPREASALRSKAEMQTRRAAKQ